MGTRATLTKGEQKSERHGEERKKENSMERKEKLARIQETEEGKKE